MTADDQKPPERKKRRKMSRSILLAARHGGRRRQDGAGKNGENPDQARPDRSEETITLGEILEDLGERSFGWCLFVFTLISLLPLPIGSNMLTALPVIWVAGQMAAGYHHIHLPRIMTDRAFKRRSVRATIHRFRFLLRPLERIAHPRRPELFTPSREERLSATNTEHIPKLRAVQRRRHAPRAPAVRRRAAAPGHLHLFSGPGPALACVGLQAYL